MKTNFTHSVSRFVSNRTRPIQFISLFSFALFYFISFPSSFRFISTCTNRQKQKKGKDNISFSSENLSYLHHVNMLFSF